VAAKLKWLGVKPGVPDIFIVWRGRSIFIELKAHKGSLSDAQKAMQQRLILSSGLKRGVRGERRSPHVERETRLRHGLKILDRILAVDLTSLINDAVKANIDGESAHLRRDPVWLRVCAAVIIADLPEEKRAAYVQSHMLGTAEMLGIPLIPMEVDMPDKESMN
jgi:hypothetical protein